ncbi:MAG TPA: TolC family protein [Tepidisphaeraceae bacterium]|nr:TolC family protein [Tepidisphaeraceae bacterium]
MARAARIVVAAAVATAALWGGGCGLKEEPIFDPTAMSRPYRDQAAGTVTRPLEPLPTELNREYLDRRDGAPPAPGGAGAAGTGPGGIATATRPVTLLKTTQEKLGTVARLSLRDLVQLAAINSLDVKVAGYQPAIDEARVTEAEANFDPVFFANVTASSQWILQPSLNNVTIGGNTRFDSVQAVTGLRQNLPTGGQVELGYTWNRVYRSPNLSNTFNPSHESDLVLRVTQPLLRNFGAAVNRARIDVARNTQKVSLLDFRISLEKQLAEIEEAYWQLYAAERELAVQERLFETAAETSRLLQARLGRAEGVTRVPVAQANAALRQREASLVALRTRVKQLSDEIKVRVNDPDLSITRAVTILPADVPLSTPLQFDLVEQLDTALQNRAELSQQRIRIDSARIVQEAAKNNMLPTLNLVGSVGLQGASNGWWNSIDENVTGDFPQYSIGFQLEVPLGNREARAIWVRTKLQRQQALDQYRLQIERVAKEVRDAHNLFADGWERIRLTTQSVDAARDALEAQQVPINAGAVKLDPDVINRLLQQQEVLAIAAREQARALADYNIAIAQLERAKGTILKYDNVMMAEDPLVNKGPKLYGSNPDAWKK